MSRPRPVPGPTGLVVKNGSKMRSRICSGMPVPLSMTRTTTRCGSRFASTSTRPASGDGVQRVVDQVRPDLVQLAGETAHARQAGFHLDHHGDRFARAFDFSTATVLLRPCARSTGSATVA